MAEKLTIRAQYEADDSARADILERARLCAALSKPWLCPPAGRSQKDKLPENYQSLGSRGIMNMEGRMLMALFPPGQPWFQLKLTSDIKYDQSIPPETIQEFEWQLFLRELTIQATLESAHIKPRTLRKMAGFRSQKRLALSQLLVTGDVLEQLTDDYRIKTYRRDQYVTRRDSTGDVLYHTIKEQLDPLALPEEKLIQAGLNPSELAEKFISERLENIYTMIERQPQSKTWVIRQELNKTIINESEEKNSPIISTH